MLFVIVEGASSQTPRGASEALLPVMVRCVTDELECGASPPVASAELPAIVAFSITVP